MNRLESAIAPKRMQSIFLLPFYEEDTRKKLCRLFVTAGVEFDRAEISAAAIGNFADVSTVMVTIRSVEIPSAGAHGPTNKHPGAARMSRNQPLPPVTTSIQLSPLPLDGSG
jgi:hypothetical protein